MFLYWIQHEPQFGKQAVYLGRSLRNHHAAAPSERPEHLETQHAGTGRAGHQDHRAADVGAVDGGERQDCPFSLCQGGQGRWARHHHLDVERSGRIVEEVLTKGTSSPSFYYQSTLDALDNDGDILVTLDALAKIGILDFLRLVGDGDLLCELHGLEIVPPSQSKAGCGEDHTTMSCAGP